MVAVDHLPPALIEAYGALSPDAADRFPTVFARLTNHQTHADPRLNLTATELDGRCWRTAT
jgi:hypothetical protein